MPGDLLTELSRSMAKADPSKLIESNMKSLLFRNPTAGVFPGNLPESMPRRYEMPGMTLANLARLGAAALADSAGDTYELAQGISERDPWRTGFGGAGLALPFISAGVIKGISENLFRGGREKALQGFFSRDLETARGFDKGSLGIYKVESQSVLDFTGDLTPEEAKPIFRSMRSMGDNRTADLLEKIIEEDEGIPGGLFYMLLERNAAASPEAILKEAGIDAIDTGRDIRVLRPGVAEQISELPSGGK